MAAWVDLAALHNPTAGQRPPASWGDGINSNVALLGSTAAATVLTSQTTTSTTFTDLSTVGPSVTLDTATTVICMLGCQMTLSAAGFMSVAVSGATTAAATDDRLLYMSVSGDFTIGSWFFITGLTAGTNTFTAKYRVGSGTQTFLRRRIAVIPLSA